MRIEEQRKTVLEQIQEQFPFPDSPQIAVLVLDYLSDNQVIGYYRARSGYWYPLGCGPKPSSLNIVATLQNARTVEVFRIGEEEKA